MVEGGGLASWRTEEIEAETESIAHVKDGGDKGSSFRPSAFYALFRLEIKNFWVSHRMCRKDIGRDFYILIKKQIT